MPRGPRQETTDTPSSSKSKRAISPTKSKVLFISANDSSPTKTPRKRGRPAGTPRSGNNHETPRSTSQRRLRKRKSNDTEFVRVLEDEEAENENDEEKEVEEGSISSESDEGHNFISKLEEGAIAAVGQGFIHRTAFDAYFSAASKPSRTSDNVFSELVQPFTPDEYARILAQSEADKKHTNNLRKVQEAHERLFPRYALELSEGFNLLFFGFGSKRNLLNKFATSFCARRGHVVIVNGFMPRIGIKDLIGSIEEIPRLTDLPLSTGLTGLEAQTHRIYEYFMPPASRSNASTASHPLFLIIHNIDSPNFRSLRAKALLSLLALNPRIHLVGSVDHINAQMIWTLSESSTRKHIYDDETRDIPPTRGFAWLWHDMTTLEHYEAETAHLEMGTLGGRSTKGTAAERGITETAAQHILLSVNIKAKRLFALLAKTLLTSIEEAGTAAKGGEKPFQAHAISYQALFNAARDDFIATNDTSFKALLAEFFDHGLVLTLTAGGTESLWIPLRVEELRRVLNAIKTE